MRGPRTAVVWILQSLLVCLLLFLLWQPALSIATLRPQQNIVAVVIDDSKSMSTQEDGHSRKDQVLATLNGGLLNSLKSKFQVRLYRLGDHLERIESAEQAECLGSRHAHRRGPEGSAGRFGHAAHRRSGSDERRRGQQRRHRSRHHLRHQAAAHSHPHRRVRPRAHGARHRADRCPDCRRARSQNRAWRRRSRSTSGD